MTLTRAVQVLSLFSLMAFSLSLALPAWCADAAPADSQPLTADTPEKAAIRGRLMQLREAELAGDAHAMASVFAPDAQYTDDDGTKFQGRDAIEKDFTELLKENGRPQVQITPDGMRMPAPNIALVDGIINRAVGDTWVPVNRFALVLTQDAGQWWISSATETPINKTDDAQAAAPNEAVSSLADMAWLLGDWEAKRGDASVRMKAEWAPSKRFILCKYEVEQANQPKRTDMQVIGVNPRTGQIVSWMFDSNGGFGHGTWSRDSNQWYVDSVGTKNSGMDITATSIIVPHGDNFSWQAVNRRVGGILVGDTEPLTVKRMSK